MIRLLAYIGLAFALLSPAVAQERHAAVKLEDGRSLEGRVLLLNLETLEIEVDNKVLKIPASQIRSCRIRQGVDPATIGANDGPAGQVPVAAATVDPATVDPATADAGGAGQGPAGAAKPGTVVVADDAATASTEQGRAARITWTAPLPDPVVPGSSDTVPVDQRDHSLWQRRIGALDRAYPWMAPAARSQWLSLGLLLLVGCGLVVHLSARVAGGEAIQLGRSIGVGVWYMVSGLAQVALVPISDLNIVLMLLLNTSLALFALCSLFGLARISAAVALTVQLGFGVLVFGILELVNALLGSVGVAP